MKHETIEKNVGLLLLLMILAVSIGGLTQIVPLFFQDVTNKPVEGMKPYTALQLEGRDIYICLLYTSPSPRDGLLSRMPSSA